MKYPVWAAIVLLAANPAVRAQDLNSLPPYRPARQVDRTIHSWGHGFLKTMMKYWEAGFQRYQPNARFEDDLFSSAAAMAGLYSGRADLGVLAREITPPETAAYEKFARQKTCAVDVLTGSYGDPDKIMALGVFVGKDSPVTHLTFSQLDAIFGAERRRGERENIRTWGQLGVTGEGKGRPIHPYSGPAFEAPGYYFSQRVLKGSVLWNPDLRQYDDVSLAGGKTLDGYQRVIDAAGADPDSIALTGAGYSNPNMKLVALAAEEGGPYVDATPRTVIDRAYPLSRPVRFYINNGPALPPDPDVIEFLRYVVSREGQEAALKEGVFLPLNAAAARAQMAELDSIEATMVDIPEASGLRLVATIALPQMTGTWDHLTADPKSGRLFISAQEDHAIDVVDLGLNRPIRRISGFFNRPQGECYLPDLDKLVVTNGRDGTCKILDGRTYELEHTIQLSMGADMIDYDRETKLLYVESGGKDSNRGPGKLTVIDARTGRVAGEIVTDFRAAALAMESGSARLYAALPGANQIAVLDRTSRRLVSRIPVAGRPASLALDETGHRLFVATRTFKDSAARPGLFVIDTQTGGTIASLDSPDATENMFYDAAHRRIYTSSLEGTIAVYRQIDRDRYEPVARIAAVPHAGTSQFIPERNRFCVALPPHDGRMAQVWVFDTAP